MNFANLSPEHVQEFRNVFSTTEGVSVLQTMLWDLGFFREAKNDEERVLRNYAVRLVGILAAFDPDACTLQFINILKSVPIKKDG